MRLIVKSLVPFGAKVHIFVTKLFMRAIAYKGFILKKCKNALDGNKLQKSNVLQNSQRREKRTKKKH